MTAKKLYRIRFDDTATGGPMTWVRKYPARGEIYVTENKEEAGLFTRDAAKNIEADAADMVRTKEIVVCLEALK